MLLIRKARPLLWDQPSLRVCGGSFHGGKKEGEKRRGGAAEGQKKKEETRGWTRWDAVKATREGEMEKRARGLFPARPTSGKTPLIGTWLPVGATNSIGGGGREALLPRQRRRRRWRRRWWIERGKAAAVPAKDRRGRRRRGRRRARSAHSVTLTGKPY